jgi:hypothetical protein
VAKNYITKFEHPRVILSAFLFTETGLISATMRTGGESGFTNYYSIGYASCYHYYYSMQKPHFTQEQLVQVAKLSDVDIERTNTCRGTQSKIGYAYQICYVKLFNRLPPQSPLEILDELAIFVAIQVDIPKDQLHAYALRQPTISEHQEQIRAYLRLEIFSRNIEDALCDYLFQQALQIQETESLFLKATEFLKERRVLNPTDYTIERLIKTQREKARIYIFEKIVSELTPALREELDSLLIVGTETYSKLYQIKEEPRKPSEKAMKLLASKLTTIEQTGVLGIKLDWLNNNYKRYFSKYVFRADANKLRELTPMRRYAALVCFLQEAYQDTKDQIFDMYRKAVNRVGEQAERTVDDYNKSKRGITRSCLSNHKKLCGELLAVVDGVIDIQVLLKKYPQANLQAQIEVIESLLAGKYSHNLNVVADRFSYLRQMARPLLEKLTLELAPTANASLETAFKIVREIIQDTRRSVPGNINLDFLPKSVRQAIREDGGINRKRFEAAVFTELPNTITHGDVAIAGSKRYGKLENFFIDPKQWEAMREAFFQKSKESTRRAGGLGLTPEGIIYCRRHTPILLAQ